MTRERCKCCQRYNPVGFKVDDVVWDEVVPAEFVTSVLCIMCFDQFATEVGVAWDREGVAFYPISRIMSRAVEGRFYGGSGLGQHEHEHEVDRHPLVALLRPLIINARRRSGGGDAPELWAEIAGVMLANRYEFVAAMGATKVNTPTKSQTWWFPPDESTTQPSCEGTM